MKKYKYRKTFTFNGKRYAVYADTEKELMLKMGKKMADLESGTVTPTSKTLVKDYTLAIFEAYRKPKVKEITYNGYITRLNDYIFPYIGHKRIQDVQRMDCQNCLNKLEGYASSTIKFVRSTLNYIFSQAVLDGLIRTNPASKLALPKGTKQERNALTAEEEKAFLAICMNTHKYDVFLLSYFCGCRPSEARDIKDSDIVEMHGKKMLHINGTKNKKANRFVPIPEVLLNHLEGISGYIGKAPTSDTKLTVDQYQRKWRYLKLDMDIYLGCKVFRRTRLEPSKLQDELPTYALRHTYCTNLVKANVPLIVIQKLMGHNNLNMVSEVYAHVNNNMIADYADVLDGIPYVIP